MNLFALYQLAKVSGYNAQNKEIYRREALKQLKKFADTMSLKPETFNVRFNAGGIAVAGEAILHHDKFYLQINEYGVYWRTVKSQKDYLGGPNRWLISMTGADDSQGFEKQIIKLLS